MKKLLILALALAVVVTMLAVPAAADGPADYDEAVIKAADRLVANQNTTDGGFPWGLTGSSTTNTLGITAMGILKAYNLGATAAYDAALTKAYTYAKDTAPGYTEAGTWTETIAGVDSSPDITFLIGLANTPVLSAPAAAATLAKDRWDTRVEKLGGGTATGLAEVIRDARFGAGYYDCIPWDLEAAVKAALALDSYYPLEGYEQQAKDIAEVIYASDGHYFDSADKSQEGYILLLTGAIEAFAETGLHSGKAADLKNILLGEQDADGWWKWYGATPADMSVQHTAYAVMALFAQGDDDARAGAIKGADWLLSSQEGDGGWYAEGGTGDECLEVDSEAAWALYMAGRETSRLVAMTANIPAVVSISVDPPSIDYGTISAGNIYSPTTLTVSNCGTVEVTVTHQVVGDTLFTDNDNLTVTPTEKAIAFDDYHNFAATLTVPDDYQAKGVETGTIIFWATP